MRIKYKNFCKKFEEMVVDNIKNNLSNHVFRISDPMECGVKPNIYKFLKAETIIKLYEKYYIITNLKGDSYLFKAKNEN